MSEYRDLKRVIEDLTWPARRNRGLHHAVHYVDRQLRMFGLDARPTYWRDPFESVTRWVVDQWSLSNWLGDVPMHRFVVEKLEALAKMEADTQLRRIDWPRRAQDAGGAVRTHAPFVSHKQLHIRDQRCRVYFAIGEDGSIKIGTSKSVVARVRSISRETKQKMSILAVISGDREVERIMHDRFYRARIKWPGEWFRPVPELLAYIEGVKAA